MQIFGSASSGIGYGNRVKGDENSLGDVSECGFELVIGCNSFLVTCSGGGAGASSTENKATMATTVVCVCMCVCVCVCVCVCLT